MSVNSPVADVPISNPFLYILYPATPILSEASSHIKSIVVDVTPKLIKFSGTVGACVSGASPVVTLRGLLSADVFPAASYAFIVYVYVVLATRFWSVNSPVTEVPISSPFLYIL